MTSVHLTAKAKKPDSPVLLRLLATIVSVVFHPLFITAYVIAFLIYIHPAAFAGVDERTKTFRLISTVLFTIFYPGVVLFIASRLKLIHSLKMESRQDRIIGFVITMFFYWWTWNVFRNLSDIPPVAVHFTLGVFLAICLGWMCNIFFKISLHALAMGGLCTFFVIYGLNDPFASGLYLSLAVLIAGLVCTARLALGQHSSFEIVVGLLMGILGQLSGWIF